MHFNMIMFYVFSILNALVIIFISVFIFLDNYGNYTIKSFDNDVSQIVFPGLIGSKHFDYSDLKYEEISELNHTTLSSNQSTFQGVFAQATVKWKKTTRKPVDIKQFETVSWRNTKLKLKELLKCNKRDYRFRILQHGNFWILENYIQADHGSMECYETVTLATHGDLTYLDNLVMLVRRWDGPISVSLYAPGDDFTRTLDSIRYLRNCLPESRIIRLRVSFHLYFDGMHVPGDIPSQENILEAQTPCWQVPPYKSYDRNDIFRHEENLMYPVNLGRNIARRAAISHFILVNDIELFPSPGLVKEFLKMIARNDTMYRRKGSKVYVLPLFEVESNVAVPSTKAELQLLYKLKKADQFHRKLCPICQKIPNREQWVEYNQSNGLHIFAVVKRSDHFNLWEPIYIGTNAEPLYDELLSWEGQMDKMVQAYILCVLNYEFHVLDNAFLVHRPGIKTKTKAGRFRQQTKAFIRENIYPQLRKIYGTRRGCRMFWGERSIEDANDE